MLEYLKKFNFNDTYNLLLQSPYDVQIKKDHLLKLLIHYLDAAAFGTRGDLFLASQELLHSLKQNSSFLLENEELFNYLEQEHTWIQISLDPSIEFLKDQYPEAIAYADIEQRHQTSWDQPEKLLRFIPLFLHKVMTERIAKRVHLNQLLIQFKSFSGDLFHSPLPWIFPQTNSLLPELPMEKGALAVFLDPLSRHLNAWLQTHSKRKLWLLFENQTTLLQALSKVETLSDSHFYHSLDTPLSQQTFTPPSWVPQKVIGLDLSAHAFDSEEELLRLGLRSAFYIALKRLGKAYLAPLVERYNAIQWHLKQKPDLQALDSHIEHLLKLNPSRALDKPSKQRKKIAHITTQLVDAGHAPSQLIETILLHQDKTLFEPMLICCEEHALRKNEYPFNLYASAPSTERGSKRMARIQNHGIPIFIDDAEKTIETTARNISHLLDQQDVDLAIFHGPSLIHTLCAAGCRVPVKVLFEHGTLPTTKGFEYAILSAKETEETNKDIFKALKITTAVQNFPVNCRSEWQELPFSPAQLGLPEDGFIMTTISNNLELRLTPECLDAIGRILQRAPYAYYAPIGYIKNIKQFKEFFFSYGVEDRIMPLGHQDHPSQMARSMHLYLNEFPIGSGFGALEAMSAGCPIVTMYHKDGPPAAKYAAIYFGKERAVHHGDIEGYIHLAVSLYANKEQYREWSLIAKAQYEACSNIDEYMIDFERTLLNWIKEKHAIK